MRDVLTLKPSYYEALKRLTLELAGVKLGSDHAFLVETRLSGLAQREGYDSLDAMIENLFTQGQTRLAIQVVSTLVERDTHFFYDPVSFSHLSDHVLPDLARTRGGGGRIRILSFACASGQEAYGAAMRANALKDELSGIDVEIMGVDYPSQALDRAKAGRYTHFEVQRGLSVSDLIKYFSPSGEDWLIDETLRDQVKFHEMHLLSNLEKLGQFHVVMFRGTLPHYSNTARLRVLRGLSDLVKEFGYLILGSNETLSKANFGFDAVEGKAGLYRKREDIVEETLPEIDPNIKQPNGRTTFEGTHRPKRSITG